MFRRGWAATAACAALLFTIAGCSTDEPGQTAGNAQHVLLLSIDGMHQTDLTRYIRAHPDSAFAALAGRGLNYTNAQTPVPSDSFPGLIAQVTGGNPRTTGVYYDD
ncbi:MAG: hypothetical protein QOH20_3275, partial [Mycobacterium sp.]|nr:hypothetical protein [Mycobacterium sp.]